MRHLKQISLFLHDLAFFPNMNNLSYYVFNAFFGIRDTELVLTTPKYQPIHSTPTCMHHTINIRHTGKLIPFCIILFQHTLLRWTMDAWTYRWSSGKVVGYFWDRLGWDKRLDRVHPLVGLMLSSLSYSGDSFNSCFSSVSLSHAVPFHRTQSTIGIRRKTLQWWVSTYGHLMCLAASRLFLQVDFLRSDLFPYASIFS